MGLSILSNRGAARFETPRCPETRFVTHPAAESARRSYQLSLHGMPGEVVEGLTTIHIAHPRNSSGYLLGRPRS